MFIKGQSGNPSGRPKDPVRALARQHGEEAIHKLVDWMRSDNAKASITACSVLLDRGFGKPDATINLGVSDDVAQFLNRIGVGPSRGHHLELEAEPEGLRDAVPGGNA